MSKNRKKITAKKAGVGPIVFVGESIGQVTQTHVPQGGNAWRERSTPRQSRNNNHHSTYQPRRW